MGETMCGECGEVYPTEGQATTCADADVGPRRLLPWRKCHPHCPSSPPKCWWDQCWLHVNFCLGYFRGLKWPGPLYWICPDCRGLVNDERAEARAEGKVPRW